MESARFFEEHFRWCQQQQESQIPANCIVSFNDIIFAFLFKYIYKCSTMCGVSERVKAKNFKERERERREERGHTQ